MPDCDRCGRKITAEEAVIIPISDPSKPNQILCAACARTLPVKQPKRENSLYSRGLFFCIVGAALGALIWYELLIFTHQDIPLLAVMTGWLAGQAYLIGVGHKRNLWGQVTAAAITFFAITIFQYFSVSYQTLSSLSQAHFHDLPLIIPLQMAYNQTLVMIARDPFVLVIWAAGLWVAWFWTAERKISGGRV